MYHLQPRMPAGSEGRRRGGGGGGEFIPERNASGYDLSQKDPSRHPRWDHVVSVVDRNGKLIESWEQHNKLFVRPHRVLVNPVRSAAPYLAGGRWRARDLQVHARRKDVGADHRHADAIRRRPDPLRAADRRRVAARRDFFVSDGYVNTRVVKFDKDGKFLMTWGQTRHAAERNASELYEHGACDLNRQESARLRERSLEFTGAGVRRKRQIPGSLAERAAARIPSC